MKLFYILRNAKMLAIGAIVLTTFSATESTAQVSTVCTDPTNIIYGLTGNGAIYPINVNTGNTSAATKNTTYSGNSANKSNGLGYNSTNGKFYYFKRNVGASPQEFVSFDPATNTVAILASSTLPSEIHTGTVSANGLGYYTIDVNANMAYYNIATNTWTNITSSFTDHLGNNVSTVITSQSAGDIAIDGWGNLWIITSSSSNFALYRMSAPLPTSAVAGVTVRRIIAPTTATPSGNSIAGIAFNPTGQIYMATKSDDRLYRLENNLSLTFAGSLSTSDVGNDLTSCSFPFNILPVTWINFNATSKGKKTVELTWEVSENQNEGFYVQHSSDGSNWAEIGFIKSKGSNGSIYNYSFTHINNQDGKQFYRLKQRDLNQKENYSTIKTVTLKNETPGIIIWPNPASEVISFNNKKGESGEFVKAFLYDLTGRKVIEKSLQPGLNTINISAIDKGIYILKLEGPDQNKIVQKIVKQ